MNSKEIERLYFEWLGIYRVLNSKGYKAMEVRSVLLRLGYLIGLI